MNISTGNRNHFIIPLTDTRSYSLSQTQRTRHHHQASNVADNMADEHERLRDDMRKLMDTVVPELQADTLLHLSMLTYETKCSEPQGYKVSYLDGRPNYHTIYTEKVRTVHDGILERWRKQPRFSMTEETPSDPDLVTRTKQFISTAEDALFYWADVNDHVMYHQSSKWSYGSKTGRDGKRAMGMSGNK